MALEQTMTPMQYGATSLAAVYGAVGAGFFGAISWDAMIAVVVSPAIVAVIAAVINSKSKAQDAKLKQAEKEADWKRQDEVAERLLKSNRAVADAAIKAATITGEKLQDLAAGQKSIHTLVNSNLTAEMEQTITATERELAVLYEMVALKKQLKVEPSEKTIALINAAEESLVDMRERVKERLEATRVANAQKSG